MADNKSINIGTNLEPPKMDPRFERVLKQMGNITAKYLNTSDLKKYNIEAEKNVKILQKMGIGNKELYKTMRNEGTRALKEQTKVMKDYGQEMDRVAAKASRAQATAARWVNRQGRNMRPGSTFDMAGAAGDMAERWTNQYRDQMQKGAEYARNIAEQQQQERDQAKGKMLQKAMWAGAGMQIGGQVISGVGNMIFGGGQQRLGYEAQKAQMAGNLYNELTSGNTSSLFALKGAGMEKLIGLSKDAYRNSVANQIGTGVSQAGSAVTAGSMAVATGGLSLGMGGGSQLADSTMGLANTGLAAYRGKTGADQAQATMEALQLMKALNPVEQRQYQEVEGRMGQIATFLNRGGNGAKLGDMRELIRSGNAGGLSTDETLSTFEGLRNSMGHQRALSLTGSVAQSEDAYGVGRSSAATALAGLSRVSTSSQQADAKLVEVMRKAMSMGINDSRLKEVFLESIPSLVYSMGGKAVNSTSSDMYGRMLQSAFTQTGDASMATDIASGARQVMGNLSTGNTNLQGYNTQRFGAFAGAMGGVDLGKDEKGRKRHLGMSELLPLSKLGIEGIGTQAFDDVVREKFPDITPEQIEKLRAAAIKGSLGGNYGAGFSNKAGVRILLAQNQNTMYDAVTAFEKMAESGNIGKPVNTDNSFTGLLGNTINPQISSTSADAQRFGAGRAQQEANKSSPLLAGLADDSKVQQLVDKMNFAGGAIIKVLEQAASYNSEELQNVPKLLDDVALSLGRLGVAANGALGTPTAGQ